MSFVQLYHVQDIFEILIILDLSYVLSIKMNGGIQLGFEN